VLKDEEPNFCSNKQNNTNNDCFVRFSPLNTYSFIQTIAKINFALSLHFKDNLKELLVLAAIEKLCWCNVYWSTLQKKKGVKTIFTQKLQVNVKNNYKERPSNTLN